MNKKIINVFLIILAAVIVVVVARDLGNNRPGQSNNPYKLDIDTFLHVDPSLIGYEEYRQINLPMEEPTGIALLDQRMFLVGDRKLQVISTGGKLLSESDLDEKPTCISALAENLLGIGFGDHFGVFRDDGTLVTRSDIHSNSSVFTAIASSKDRVYIADAGIRRVLVYDTTGNFKSEFRGETGDGSSHGFVIPSPNFHLEFDPRGRLWVNNPGVHTLQHYDENGKLVESWSKSSPGIEGFSGCCNPARFAFLADGRFVTSEKGLVRLKIYSASGQFESVVAAPSKFTVEGHAPGLAVDDNGHIIALDIDKKMIRFFRPS